MISYKLLWDKYFIFKYDPMKACNFKWYITDSLNLAEYRYILFKI